ncbi:tryptophan halogenase family protein [Pseudoalteromonas piscicida]|uniref:Tryptophan halogenase n=1 Tax=Pseudoalteromonas piscicida TaxID=43662 RepID=A0A2A5JPS0_PSEO7|nr:tryptophan halogenase family protein [Pseudoalteromonas piscicida]PCK31261.1 tryptophan halogenase [Pseudoalteromonas piscicida]
MINSYVVVGGGTAGWLTACILAKKLSEYSDKTVTLIESPDIPPIGVGEGTVPSIRETLKMIGISETDLFSKCDATFKQSIKFESWLKPGADNSQHYYHHLFDFPFPFGESLSPLWQNLKQSGVDTPSFASLASIQEYQAELGRAPKRITDPEYTGISDYAYHFDALKFARLLKEHGTSNLGIRHVTDNVVTVNKKSDGSILNLNMQSGITLEFDFFVDCTGFKSVLLGDALEVPFIPKSDVILTDKALTIQVPNLSEDIPPYTISKAHRCGWIWDIALTSRRGVGFVYSSKHLSDDDAINEFGNYLGMKLNADDVRVVDMRIGFREKFWYKNCVAIGLSQGFIEPLEATAILLSDFSANLFCNKLPQAHDDLEVLSERFNERVSSAWNSVVDFVKLHYCISDRDDSQFWLDNRNDSTIPDSLLEKLALWKLHGPTKDDFTNNFEVFRLENYLYVLLGMEYSAKYNPVSENQLKRLQEQAERVKSTAEQVAQQTQKQLKVIEAIKQYGLSKC